MGAQMHHRRFRMRPLTLVIALPAIGAGVLLTGAVGATPGALVSSTCNRQAAGDPSIEFQVESVTALEERIPEWGLAPELDRVSGPLTVVIFEGPHLAIPVYGVGLTRDDEEPAEALVFDDVVCVVRGGIENYYSEVDLIGVDLAGLSAERFEP